MSLEEVASHMEVDPSLMRSWIDKDYTMKINQAIHLSQILNVSLNHLFLEPSSKVVDITNLDLSQIRVIQEIIDPAYRDKKKVASMKNVDQINRSDYGNRLRFVRSEILLLTQKQMGKVFYVGRNTSKYWDMGENFMSLDRARDLSILSNISLDFILLPNHPLELISYNIEEDMFDVIERLVVVFGRQSLGNRYV